VKSPKTYLILLLALTTVGGAALAWRQYHELVELRAAAMNKSERADLQKRLWDLEKLNRELQDQLLAARGEAGGGMEGLLAGADGERPEGEPGRGGRGERGGRGPGGGMQQMNAIRDLMAKPEVQAMLSVQQKAALEARYAALFKNLNLPPEQIERLKSLLLDRQTTVQDVFAAAREQGINPRSDPDAFRKLVADAQNEVNNSIKAAIGDAGFAQLQQYEQTQPQRNLVNDLTQRLNYSDMPLSAAQAEQLVQILAANQPERRNPGEAGAPTGAPSPGGRGGPGGGLFGGGMVSIGGPGGLSFSAGGDNRGGATAQVTAGAIAQAQSVLAPSQLAALQQIQQQQQTQQQLQQLVRETVTASQAASGAKAGNTAQPRRKGGG